MAHPNSSLSEFRDGLADLFPALVAAAPIGLLFGAIAASKGLSPLEVALMSGLVFAGGAQLAAIEMWTTPVPVVALIVSTLLINARYVLMSASLAPKVAHLPLGGRILGFHVLADENWTLAERRAATAQNMRSALLGALDRMVGSELRADSTLLASDRFFDVSDGQAPQRVDIVTTPEAATAVRAGTPDDTVYWYTADAALDVPRATSVARVDSCVRVAYGARANELGTRRMVSNFAAFAAIEFDLSSEASKESYSIMALRVRDRLGEQGGQTVSTIKSELVVVEQALNSAAERQQNARVVFADLVADIEGVDKDAVATRILELQTRLQASYQTTALISRLSLVQYLS